MSIPPAGMTSAEVALSLITKNDASSVLENIRKEQERRAGTPALSIDPRTAQLADALLSVDAAASGVSSMEIENEGSTNSNMSAAMDARREMLASAEQTISWRQMGEQRSQRIVELYEQTGELYTPDMEGALVVFRPQRPWAEGELERLIQGTRDGVEVSRRVMPSLIEAAEQMRKALESK